MLVIARRPMQVVLCPSPPLRGFHLCYLRWVKLTATAKPGYRFSDWRSAADPAWGGANVTNAVIWRKMVTNDTVTARLVITQQEHR